ncbi:hypothetical protein BBJ28_00005340 [Nothophytophthora sp. Chile5]|nr:hypothetical protein BBJ28_00005340 [Nothophytophthora sp. Chile5]
MDLSLVSGGGGSGGGSTKSDDSRLEKVLGRGSFVGDVDRLTSNEDATHTTSLVCTAAGSVFAIHKHDLQNFLLENPGLLMSLSGKLFVLDVVATLYQTFLAHEDDRKVLASVRSLEALGYLESGLWPLAAVTASAHDCRHHVKKAWVVSVMLLVGCKAREGDCSSSSAVWSFLTNEKDGEGEDTAWKAFMSTLQTLLLESEADDEWSLSEQTVLTQFLITCFQSLEVPQVAASVLQLTSLPLWTALSPTQRTLEFQTYPKLERHWRRVTAASEAASESTQSSAKKSKRRKLQSTPSEAASQQQNVLLLQLGAFFQLLKTPVDVDTARIEVTQRLRFVALFLALLTDLLSQLPTRRFLLTLLRRRHVRSVLRNSAMVQHALQWRSVDERQALNQQLALLDACMRFPIDAHTGASLSTREHRERQTRHIQTLQHCAFQSHRNSRLEDLAIAPCAHIADTSNFTEMLNTLVAVDRPRLVTLAIAVGVLADQSEAEELADVELVAFFVEEYSTSSSDGAEDTLASSSPVFPTELDLWNKMLERKDVARAKTDTDESMEEEEEESVYGVDDSRLFPLLPVRKLGLQFLNLADYLQRNYELFRLEATQDIRGDLEVAVKQLDAVRALRSASDNDTIFRGFSRSAVPLTTALKIVKVAQPALGQTAPASVIAQLEAELTSRHDSKRFDCYQPKEMVFLVTLRATADEGAEMLGFQQRRSKDREAGSFPEEYGVQYVRAAEIVEVSDAFGKQINDENPVGRGRKRLFKLALDGVQYKRDLEAGGLDAYEQVNVLVRRKPRENNFKAVLDTVAAAWHDANKEELLPAWLHDLFLGYGDPTAAHYTSICKAKAMKQVVVPLTELLQDGEHALEAGGAPTLVDAEDETQLLEPKDAVAPFTYVGDVRDGTSVLQAHRKGKSKSKSSPLSKPPTVRFTKAQVAAVRSGVCEGLTLVVGPPGTGKTDVAVQLVLKLYHSTPAREKLLVVAHSNQALNDFFAKLLAEQSINEAEIVRMGQSQLASDSSRAGKEDDGAFHADFSRNGRVAFLLERRAMLLNEVELMAQWLAKRDAAQYAGLAGGSASYSCENALFFYQFHMKAFLDAARLASSLSAEGAKDESVATFVEFFTLRKGAAPENVEALRQFAMDIESYFTELRRVQPFELLQTPRQRGDLYLIHHARIVAMTCTHAALNHRKLASLGLTFGSLVMEEAAQVSELDSLVPLLLACKASLANGSASASGLQRVVLMGDPKQLPPVVKSQPLKSYAHLDQSLFTRLLRLGVPPIVLDQQGRCRPELAAIYRWRYDGRAASGETTTLGDLPRVQSAPEYQSGNAGFAHVAQFVDLSGAATERQTRPFAFESEEEARFVVALVRYMLTVGYRAEQITVLTTYNAQKELLQRLLRAQDGFGDKCKVSTVDRFQGQQNDFVLLSTVRSGAAVGHLRDVRRASTAFSRARLGLYVVGCRDTLQQARELQPFLSKLVAVAGDQDKEAATKLALVPTERVGEEAKKQKTKREPVVHVSGRQQLEKLVADLASKR